LCHTVEEESVQEERNTVTERVMDIHGKIVTVDKSLDMVKVTDISTVKVMDTAINTDISMVKVIATEKKKSMKKTMDVDTANERKSMDPKKVIADLQN
jgi:hypothetical protein